MSALASIGADSVQRKLHAKQPCAQCRRSFRPERSTAIFCSPTCRSLARYYRTKGRSGAARLTTGIAGGRLVARGADCYETPEEAVLALLRHEQIPPMVWEPCCGPGAIARILRAHGRHVIATDLVNYASPDQDAHGRDFLLEQQAPYGCDAIVTNPPFKLAGEFVEHALRLAPRVVMLLRLAFLESERRCAILEGGQLARVLVFRNRLPMMHRHGWQGSRTGSNGIAFGWFVWDAEHDGDATIRRIAWERAP